MQSSNPSRPILGIMSGTSLDGVDLALCLFTDGEKRVNYQFLQTETVPLSAYWLELLADPFKLTGEELAKAHIDFGKFLGEVARDFLKRTQTKPRLIASHGHTLFHNPASGYTFQLGHGAAIAHTAGVDTVSDFRTGDVALGGQGAPLVPIGDELLFGSFDGCLNLGGFSNISCRMPGKGRIGFDVSPANFVLNYLANQQNLPYDDGGQLAATGSIIQDVLHHLNALPYYEAAPPKSLGAEWVNEHVFPLLDTEKYIIPDLLRTVTEHIAHQIAVTAHELDIQTLLCTGGGAKNSFLMQRLGELFSGQLTIPDHKTIDFKEALVFALLGHLRVQEQRNILSTVTGARLDSCAGALYKAFPQMGY